MITRRHGIQADQREWIKEWLPGREGQVGRTAKDNRLFVDAVLHRCRAGIPWRNLPERFGDFRVIHIRHTRRGARGVWQRVVETLAVDADNEYAMIDSTIVRAHRHGAGAKKRGLPPMRLAAAAAGRARRSLPRPMRRAGRPAFTRHQDKRMIRKVPMPCRPAREAPPSSPTRLVMPESGA